MTTIAELVVKLIGDATQFSKAMGSAKSEAVSATSTISSTLKSVGGDMMKAGAVATAGLTVPIVAFGAKSVQLASDLNETKSKVQVLFGSMSDDILKWSETSATALGQSQQQALDAASNFAIFGQAANLAGDDLNEFSKSNVALASDLASFFNTNPEEAITAIGAAYRGEAEPIRKYGVLINDAAVKQQAMKMGLLDANGTLSQQSRILAVNALIMAQTSAAQGDFARTSGGLANSTRIMKAELADASAKLGQQLLPLVTQGVKFLSKLIEAFSSLPAPVQKGIVVVLGLLAALGPVLTTVGAIVSAIGAIAPIVSGALPALGAVAAFLTGPIGIAIAVVIGLIALLAIAWKNNWGNIQGKAKESADFIKWVFNGVVSFFRAVFQPALNNLRTLMQAFHAASTGDWRKFGELIRKLWDDNWKALVNTVSTVWNTIKNTISNAISNIVTRFKTTDWKAVGKAILEGIANGIKNGVKSIIDAAKNAARAALEAAEGFLGINHSNQSASGGSKSLAGAVSSANRSVYSAGSKSSNASNAEVVSLLREIASKREFNEDTMVRKLRDLFVQVTA